MVVGVFFRASLWAAYLLISISVVYGQKVMVKAPKEIEVGQKVQIEYCIQTRDGDVSVAQNPNSGGLSLLYGPSFSQSSQVSNINGKVISLSEACVTYVYSASVKGTYRISGLKLSCSGKELLAPTVTIKAREALVRSTKKRFLLISNLDSQTVYEKQALPVSYQIQASENFSLIERKLPTYNVVLSQEASSPSLGKLRLERIKGADLLVVDVAHQILFPQQAGEVVLPPAEAKISYELSDNGFTSDRRYLNLSSGDKRILVKSLPLDDRPDDFSGAVGQFTIRTEFSKKKWRTNEPVVFKIIIEGEGNLKAGKTPQCLFPEAIDVYDPVETSDETFDGKALKHTRVIEYTLMPRHTGPITIPEIRFSYFDPRVGEYRTKSTDPVHIDIEQGEEASSSTELVYTSTLEDTSNPFSVDRTEYSTYRFHILWHLSLHLLVLGCALGIYRYLVAYRAARANAIEFSASRAAKVTSRRLRKALEYLEAQNPDTFYEELLNALWGYLGDKLRILPASLSRANISEALSAKSVSKEIINELTETIDAIEYARYAPATLSEGLPELYQRTIRLIEHLERYKL